MLADQWNASRPDGTPPVLMGQHFQFVGTPNRYCLPAFYELHVWAWKDNPFGTFVDWNPEVSCAEFNPSGSTHRRARRLTAENAEIAENTQDSR